MSPPRNDRRKKKADDHSKTERIQRANRKRRARKTYRVSAFIFVLIFVAVGILFTIAVANWQKANLWAGLWWGISGFLLFGIGAAFAYHYYVIKPSYSATHTAKERPYVIFKIARLKE